MILLSPEAYNKLREENDWEADYHRKEIYDLRSKILLPQYDAENIKKYSLPYHDKHLRIANEIHDMLNKIEKWNDDQAEQVRESNLQNENLQKDKI